MTRVAVAVRYGQACASCLPGICRSKNVRFDCPQCSGKPGFKACKSCGGAGWFEVECPRQYVDASVARAVSVADASRDGHMPVNGGLLDQTNLYVELRESVIADGDAFMAKAKSDAIESQSRGRRNKRLK